MAHVLQADNTIRPTVTYAQAPSRITVTGTTENCTRPESVTVVLAPPHGAERTKTVDVTNGAFTAEFPGNKSDVKTVTAYCGAPEVGSSP